MSRRRKPDESIFDKAFKWDRTGNTGIFYLLDRQLAALDIHYVDRIHRTV